MRFWRRRFSLRAASALSAAEEDEEQGSLRLVDRREVGGAGATGSGAAGGAQTLLLLWWVKDAAAAAAARWGRWRATDEASAAASCTTVGELRKLDSKRSRSCLEVMGGLEGWTRRGPRPDEATGLTQR